MTKTMLIDAAHAEETRVVVLDGNPAADIADIRKVNTVFKQWVGYDPAAIRESVKGKAGLW